MVIRQLLFDVTCVLACAYALWRGGAPERIVAVAIFLAVIGTNLFKTPHPEFFRFWEWRVTIIDALLLIVMLTVALLSTRYWPLMMTALHGVSLFAHLAKALDPAISAPVYFGLASLLSWPIVLMLIPAAMGRRARLRRYGFDPAWSWRLPSIYRAGWIVSEHSPA